MCIRDSDGIVLMASEISPELNDVEELFGLEVSQTVDEFDRRWILISLLAVFIIYQSLRRD